MTRRANPVMVMLMGSIAAASTEERAACATPSTGAPRTGRPDLPAWRRDGPARPSPSAPVVAPRRHERATRPARHRTRLWGPQGKVPVRHGGISGSWWCRVVASCNDPGAVTVPAMGGDSRCVSPGATRSWLIAVLGLLALFSGFGVGIVTGPLAAFDRSGAAMDVLIHGPPVVQVIPRVPPVAIAGVPVPSVIAAEQPRPSSLGSGQAVARAPAPTGPPTRLTVSGSA